MIINVENLSELQKQAFSLAVKPEKKTTRIVGYAGTGKTTVLACVAKEISDECVVLAPTNKAAIVLREKGIKAQTIHSFLYAPIEVVEHHKNPDGSLQIMRDGLGVPLLNEHNETIPIVKKKELQFAMKVDKENIPRIALIDEASMIGANIFRDLSMIFDFVVLFGDGFQLPPVQDTDVLNESPPDIFLDEVHRVALENPIIRFVTNIRNGIEMNLRQFINENCHDQEIIYAKYNNPQLFTDILEGSQSICYRNSTRHNLNNHIRQAKGYANNTLVTGEPIVSLENWRETKYDDYGEKEQTLLFHNGQIVEAGSDHQSTEDNMVAVRTLITGHGKHFIMPFWNPSYFDMADTSTAWWNEFQRRKGTAIKPVRGIKMDYAYAITAHKAQGSEYDSVAVFDERKEVRGGKEQGQRWLYTSCTRAKQKLILVGLQ